MQIKNKKRSKYYFGMTKLQWLITLFMGLGTFLIICTGAMVMLLSISYPELEKYVYAQPNPTPIYTLRPIIAPTTTSTYSPIPTFTPVSFTGNAQDYILQKADIPNELSIFPGSSGIFSPENNVGMLSNYSITFIRDNIDFSSETEVWSINAFVVVYNNEINAQTEYTTQSNNIKNTETVTHHKAGSINITSTNVASLITGVSIPDDFVLTEAIAIFRKENVVAWVRVTGGLESDINLENAISFRIKEAVYFAEIIANRIK